jgi:HSP90 family molecular chaperone
MAKPRTVPVNVSARILRHISRGIYRTPAGALKELISNAYDAAALKVTVNTRWPAFDTMTITDDGKGMTAAEFEQLVKHIGFSSKTAGEPFDVPTVGKTRTKIGHYGIGLLAVGQIAARMKVVSKTKNSRSSVRTS